MRHAPIRIPLLRDSHTHPLLYAAFMDGVDLNDDPAVTRESAVARVREHARSGSGGWSIAYGWNSGRYALSAQDFDDLPPLVVLNLSLHGLIVNAAGRAVLKRTDPEIVAHLDDQGWIEQHLRRVLNIFAAEGASPERLQRFYCWLLEEHGVCDAEEMLLVDENELRLFDAAGLTARTKFWCAPEQYDALPPEARAKVHGIKLFADGALGAWSAALHRPYRGTTQSGLLIYETDALAALLSRYLRAGTPMAVHAIGDRAIDQVVDAAEHIGRRDARGLRIEHAQLISEETARRAKALGIALCMQPNFSDDSRYYADRLPAGYAEANNPFRMLIDRAGYVPGEDLLLGSDGMPHGIAEGLRQALFPPHPGQVLTVEEFVAGYCTKDTAVGYIEVEIDAARREVKPRVVPAR